MNPEERIKQLLTFVQSQPEDAFSFYALALEYMKTGNTTEAEKYFQLLLNKFPDYAGTYYQYAELLRASKREEEAKAVYKKGMEITFHTNKKTYSELQNALTNLELGIEE